jgi:hypothetical protein
VDVLASWVVVTVGRKSPLHLVFMLREPVRS